MELVFWCKGYQTDSHLVSDVVQINRQKGTSEAGCWIKNACIHSDTLQFQY